VQKAKSIFQTNTNFTLNTSQGHDFFDPVNHQQTELETRSTGYNFINNCLKGGWANKTLNVFMGSPKVGKSMWLCNLCANSVKNGENSAYITLEMAYQLVAQRIGSNIFNIPIDQYDSIAKDTNYIRAKMKEYYQNSLITPGKFIIEEFPTSSATVYDIESFLLKREEELSTEGKPFKFKNIFIDYINIMKDAKNPNSENTYNKIKSICEDVRAMA
jgi:replicative DNA helicase